MINAFYFILIALFVLKILNFCVDFLAMQEKQPDLKEKVNFEIYDVTVWLTNIYITHIAQSLKK